MNVYETVKGMTAVELAKLITTAQQSAVKDFSEKLGGNREQRRRRMQMFNPDAYLRQNLRILKSEVDNGNNKSI